MIAVLIGSIALGMSAPMITKQIKAQNMTDTQFRLINTRNQDLREEIVELRERIEELENMGADDLPEGIIAFFDRPCCDVLPEDSWSDVPTAWQGRYPRIAGTVQILRYINGPNGAAGSFSVNEFDYLAISHGQLLNDSSRQIFGIIGSTYGGLSTDINSTGSIASGVFYLFRRSYSSFGGLGLSRGGDTINNLSFDSSRVVLTDGGEFCPMSVGLYMCVKN